MRKLIIVTMISIVITTISFYSCRNNKHSQFNNNEDSLKAVIAHGEYLANHVAACIHCHSKRDFSKYSGPVIPDTEGGGGEIFDIRTATLYGKNITPDTATGIGSWTDDEILRAITKGISKNGDTLYPLMPYKHFNKMDKKDLISIIAYLRTLKPIKNNVPARGPKVPLSAIYPVEELQASLEMNICPDKSDTVKYGEYLVTVGDCTGCHSTVINNKFNAELLLGGGGMFKKDSFAVFAANITPDSTTGIGTWTEEIFLNKFKLYRERKNYDYDPGKYNTIMPISDFAGMTDEDLKAIYAYLRTVPPISNKVEKYPK
ncbi:MAG TPA: cytochrome c [Chitinophagaceae bacterium]|nr:cytochrome c [Chitinophagaceae bacterium]